MLYFRRELINDIWLKDLQEKEIPLSTSFRIEELLTTDVEISKYVCNTAMTMTSFLTHRCLYIFFKKLQFENYKIFIKS